MKKINLFNFSFEYWRGYHTLLLEVCLVEYGDCHETSLFSFGWYQGAFCFDLLFVGGVKRIIKDYLEGRK